MEGLLSNFKEKVGRGRLRVETNQITIGYREERKKPLVTGKKERNHWLQVRKKEINGYRERRKKPLVTVKKERNQ